jgi:3-hydroxyacyl-CoA dehydrogenase/3a,7a,12a-trihydroxy-5b-cholest-24-enoyl-CoA hydratase
MMKTYLDRGEGKKLIPKVSAVFGFDICQKKGGPVVRSYTIDLKNG